ncbi:uncharacterized protein LOC135496555 [Lineus longissimus]|uniref:uncharacterized protein LOC135496555 n=1 Tax=Lineus longissimus TaxID=88925 RepID=UPI00315D340C
MSTTRIFALLFTMLLQNGLNVRPQKVIAECDPDKGVCDWWIRPLAVNQSIETWSNASSVGLKVPNQAQEPFWDSQNSDGRFFLLISKSGTEGVASMTAKITTTVTGIQRYCIQFHYWLYGVRDPGPRAAPSLTVRVSETGGMHKIWYDKWNRGRDWLFTEAEWMSAATEFNVTIDGRRGKQGAVAVDNIRLIEGKCPGPAEGIRKATLGEDVTVQYNHVSYTVSLNFSSPSTGCEAICKRRRMDVATLSHARTMFKSSANYAPNCYDMAEKCKEEAPDGGCDGSRYKDWTRQQIGNNCSISCEHCESKIFRYDTCGWNVYRLCIFYSEAGECNKNPEWNLKFCPRSCDSCGFLGTSNRIFTSSFWMKEDNAITGLKEMAWEGLDAALTGLCPAYNIHLGFIRQPCNALIPCLCADYEVPVYTDVISEVSIDKKPTIENTSDAACEATDGRQQVKVINLDLGKEHHVTSVMVSIEKEKTTPVGYFGPLAEPPTSPLARDPYFSVAVGRPSYVSSLIPDDWEGPAPVANDGSRDNLHEKKVPQCTYTATGATKGVHWWYVDLQGLYEVHAVTVTRRYATEDSDFTDFRIVVSNSSLVGKNMTEYFQKSPGLCHNGTVIPVKTPTLTFQCEQEIIGRYVVIMKSQLDKGIALVVCEMEVHGQPVSRSQDAVLGLPFCPDDAARLIGGNCYKSIGRAESYVQQVVNCRRWDPPFSHIVPFEDLSQVEKDALRVWLFNRFIFGKVWTKSHSSDGVQCNQLDIQFKTYTIVLTPCIRMLGALCRSKARNVYPTPLVGLPVPESGPNLEVTYDKVTFPKVKVTEDSFLLLWEMSLATMIKSTTNISLLVLQEDNNNATELTRLQLKPFIKPGINFGGFYLNKNEYLKLPKGSYVGLEAAGENLTDLLPIPKVPGNAATATEVDYYDGEEYQGSVKVNFPFRIWVLPETLGRIPQRCQTTRGADPKFNPNNYGEYRKSVLRKTDIVTVAGVHAKQYPCHDRCVNDDLCNLGIEYQHCYHLTGKEVMVGWWSLNGAFRKTCDPYYDPDIYPVAHSLKSAITVKTGSVDCTRVTSSLNRDGKLLFYCDSKASSLQISVEKAEAKICKIWAFGEIVTKYPSTDLIPKTSTMVRGNIWPPGGNTNCAPIGFSRAEMQWLQVDLLVTYNGVTAKAYYRDVPGTMAVSPKFHLFVTPTSDWSAADPYYVGLMGKVDRIISFPCSECHSGRFVTLKEVGNAKGIELCQFDVYGDRGRERRLGMASGYIVDKQITANHHIKGGEPHRARLNGVGAWCTPFDDFDKPYLQVSLTEISVISAIETQAGNGKDGVTGYTIKYGMRELDLKWYTDILGTVKVFFTENIGRDSTVHRLVTPFQCKVIRIQVEKFLNAACLRLELLGYQKDVPVDTEYKITQPMTFTSPGSPNFYGNDRTITWTITPPIGKFVRLINMTLNVAPNVAAEMKIEDWKLQSVKVCQDEYILYRNDSAPIITDAGYYVHDVSEPLQLKLHACMATAYRSMGYLEARVDFVDCPGYAFNARSCDRTFGPITTHCGYIGSPRFPAAYPDTKTCRWFIKTKPANYISVEFENFDITGDGMTCTGDKLSFVYVDNGKKVILSHHCNGYREAQTRSDWNTLLLEYNRVRTPVEAGKGFIAKFTSIDPIKEQVLNYTEGHCEDGWLRFMSGCYKYVNNNNVTLTWTQAEEKCKSLAADSHLTSIEDDYQRDFILHSLFFKWPFISENKDIYIGLTDQGHEGRFSWTDGSPFSYSNWDDGQPDGSALEGCSLLKIDSLNNRRYWNDIPCAIKMTSQYICKTPAKSVTQYSITDLSGVIGAWKQSCDLHRQFKCTNGNCIQNFLVCNAHDDCGDGSDEISCQTIKDVCPLNRFRCENGNCILISKYCDHVFDCAGGEDEAGCVWVDCNPGEFRCANGQCIKNTTLARNFVKDCVDGSDENIIGCPGFQCYSGECIPQKLHCDGIVDCMGIYKEDETGCAGLNEKKRGDGYLNCSSTGLPYNATQRCIYDKDMFGYSTACRDQSHLQRCEDFQCPNDHMKCPDHYCIPVKMICDDVIDCPSGEDERKCNDYTCPGMFKCSNSKNCIPQSAVCDGIKTCRDGDDELSCSPCPAECGCVGDSYQCSGKGSVSLPKIPSGAREINMSGNTLTSLSETFHFPFLAKLVLSSNNISHIAENVFSKLVNLFHLDLRFNKLQVISSNLFNGLARLKVLMLTGNPAVNAIEGSAFVVNKDGGGMAVTRMNLSNMAIEELYNMSLAGLEEAVTLDLANNKLHTISTSAFAKKPKLQTLNISGNDVTNFNGREAFQSLPNLQNLKSDHFRFCCQAPQVAEENCFPQKDAFSSCTDLVRLDVLRIFLWLLGSVAVLGNILVLLLRFLAREPVTANTSIIISLALADFLMGVYLFIIAGADMAFRGFYIEVDEAWRTGPGCAIAGFLSVLSSEVSVFTLAIMSVDRFLVVVFPFSKQKINLRKARILIGLSWLVGAILAGIPLIPNDYFQGKFYSRSGVCLSLHLTSDTTPGWEYSVAVNLGLNLAAFVIIAVTYGWMYLVIRRSAEMMKGKATRKKGENQEMAIARKMALIILTDFACWMPIIILGLAAMSGNVVIPGDVYAWIAVFVLPINSAANPVLYTLSSFDTLKKILFKKDPKAEAMSKTSMSYVDTQDDDDDSTVKLVNCYRDGSQLLPYVPDNPQMKTLGVTLKEGAENITLKDMVVVLRYLGKAMMALHSGGLTAVSITVDDVGLFFEEKWKPGGMIHSAYLCSGVKQASTERDLKENIEEYGSLCKKLLRHHAAHKKGT